MEVDDDACYRAIEARDRRFDGRVFVAVTTTGVYCRPFCPAPTPRRGNARFFPTAAAAQEARFRPCLRCRPEISPELATVWRGSANTVSRALGLIEAGALDEADMEALAERLGVGGRQLRRLFRQHLGASPVSVAQTRRVLLAKQLIQDTRLPMAEVAAAAGFGNVRRFNEAFQRLYRRPPGALRRAGAAEESAAAAGAVAVRLGYRSPHDWDFVASLSPRAGHPRRRGGVGRPVRARDRYRRPGRGVGRRARGGELPEGDGPRAGPPGPAGGRRARPPRLRPRRRPRGDRRATRPRSAAGAPRRRSPGPAGSRRVGRIRTRGARNPRAARRNGGERGTVAGSVGNG